MSDKGELDNQLRIGAEKARVVANATLKRVRERARYTPRSI